MIFIDTETVGLHGMAVLIQYAEDDGEIILHEVWKESIQKTLDLITWFCTKDLCFFNATFDFFHLVKIYLTFSLIEDKSVWPETIVDEIAYLEKEARDINLCLKPKSCVDLFLYARKGPFQSLMDRKDIKVRRVPTSVAEFLKDELNKIIVLDPVYFARRKKEREQWQVDDVLLPNGDINPAFKDVSLRFAPSMGLKALAKHVLKHETASFSDIEVNERYRPKELGYAPFALITGDSDNWKGAWPQVIKLHIDHWSYNPEARKYAKNDVIFTRDLYKHFGCPKSDDDSNLACAIAATRWRGFKLDIPKLRIQRDKARAAIGSVPQAPAAAKHYLSLVMDEEEQLVLVEGTGKDVLNQIKRWKQSCENCVEGSIIKVNSGCKICGGLGLNQNMENCGCVIKKPCLICNGQKHQAAIRASEILEARKAQKEVELLDKLILSGRFHASFKVIGTLSGRMSGSDGLNPQGIKATKEIRECFPLAFEGEHLSGGDFAALEVCITAAICKDQGLIDDLTIPVKCCNDSECPACEGRGEYLKKIHGLFAEALYPEMSYIDILNTAYTGDDRYLKGKASVFARIYFGEPDTISRNAEITLEHAEKTCVLFDKKYPGIKNFRDDIINRFSAMSQPGGLGTRVIFKECEEYSTSLLGYKRYFTLENDIQRRLFKLANSPPKSWKNFRIKVTRRDRVQTASGAAQSALYGSAFSIESSRIRQAGNHCIQSTGAIITKSVQAAIIKLQPVGIHPWVVRCLNVHDEVMVVTDCFDTAIKVRKAVDEEVKKFVPVVPLLRMDWGNKLKTWADK